jgi:hypothetical protein
MQTTKGFVRPPLSEEEKLKVAQKFIQSAGFQASETIENLPATVERPKSSRIVKLNLRVPESFRYDIKQIEEFTGLTMNAICTQILWSGLKKTLKEIGDGRAE